MFNATRRIQGYRMTIPDLVVWKVILYAIVMSVFDGMTLKEGSINDARVAGRSAEYDSLPAGHVVH